MKQKWPLVVMWGIIAAIGGLGCTVLPVLLSPGAIKQQIYGPHLIPWFELAWANLQFLPSMLLFFAFGAALGAAKPRLWLLLGCLANSLQFLLWIIIIVHDTRRDPASHNLWPIGFILIAILGSPALLGTFLGSVIRTKGAHATAGGGP